MLSRKPLTLYRSTTLLNSCTCLHMAQSHMLCHTPTICMQWIAECAMTHRPCGKHTERPLPLAPQVLLKQVSHMTHCGNILPCSCRYLDVRHPQKGYCSLAKKKFQIGLCSLAKKKLQVVQGVSSWLAGLTEAAHNSRWEQICGCMPA